MDIEAEINQLANERQRLWWTWSTSGVVDSAEIARRREQLLALERRLLRAWIAKRLQHAQRAAALDDQQIWRLVAVWSDVDGN